MVRVEDVAVVELDQALQDPNSPFQACSAYVSQFYQYGGEFNGMFILSYRYYYRRLSNKLLTFL